MKKIILAAFLALSLPALAATDFATSDITSGIQATLTVQNDTIHFSNLYGSKWGTVRWKVITADAGGITAQYSKDFGANWLTPPFSVNISASSANPSTAPWSNNTPVLGTYEVALPGDCTDFQILYATASTGATLALLPGRLYTPGGVTATLFDTTSAVNTAIDTGTLNLGGWEYASARYTTPAGGSGTISWVDDAGTSATLFTVPASATAVYPFAMQSPSATNVTALPATGATGALPITKRMRFQSAAVVALTSRIQIEVRR